MQYTNNFKLNKPEEDDMYDIRDFNENTDMIDTELKKRPTQDGNASKMTAEFEQASSRSNLVSGESLRLLFGKIMKWFTDLKSGAFASVANNDTTTAGGYVADARMVKVHGDEIDELNTKLAAHKSGMDHDGRYYTETEVDGKITALNKDVIKQIGQLNSELATKSSLDHSHTWNAINEKPTTFVPSSHTHDDRYYTETEINNKINVINLDLTNMKKTVLLAEINSVTTTLFRDDYKKYKFITLLLHYNLAGTSFNFATHETFSVHAMENMITNNRRWTISYFQDSLHYVYAWGSFFYSQNTILFSLQDKNSIGFENLTVAVFGEMDIG